MDKNKKRIGVAFSGGGIRAAIFHLGVLKWMAENNMLEDITRITSVSGGSLCIGLIYSHNNYKWPTSEEFLNIVLPKIKNVILKKDIQNIALIKLILSPWWWNRKVNLIAKVMRKHWGITGKIADLEMNPLWYINCTTFETGKRFRFSQKNMGDYKIGYVENPDIFLADALAASAGFPIFIGPYKLKADKYSWKKSYYSKDDSFPKDKFLHLWDGGVYDNLGLESVYKMDNCGCLSEGIDYVIVSNASENAGYQKRKGDFSRKNLKRLLDIAMDQVGALRNRSVMDYIKRTQNGVYFKIGNSAENITKASGVIGEIKEELISECISTDDAIKVCNYSTTLNKPSESDFDLILRHGYEVAKCTYVCYHSKN